MNTTAQAQYWLNHSLYPFQSHYIQTPHGQLHYLDEGEGEVILFVHGTPTWSFLYRHQIKVLSKNYRCIAVDHLGFGLSDKPVEFAGTPAAHAKTLQALLNSLQLKDITLVAHDFGGPIGLSVAIEKPHLFKRVALFNTWLWRTDTDKTARQVNAFVNSWLGRQLYLRTNFSPYLLLKSGFADKSKLTTEIHRHYLKPFQSQSQRHGLLAFARALVGQSKWYQQQWQKLHHLEGKPILLLWGMRDKYIDDKKLEIWRDRLPKAGIQTFDCGHFVPEERAKEVTEALLNFMDKE